MGRQPVNAKNSSPAADRTAASPCHRSATAIRAVSAAPPPQASTTTPARIATTTAHAAAAVRGEGRSPLQASTATAASTASAPALGWLGQTWTPKVSATALQAATAPTADRSEEHK